MITIIDYGMGNLRSVQKALEASGASTRISCDPDEIACADKIVLPGVGAVRPAMDRLKEMGLVDIIRSAISSGKPFLGICLGFQLLFNYSTEGGRVDSLGILSGSVEKFPAMVKVPQMGWNSLHIVQNACPMYKGIKQEDFVYFCHSYYARPDHLSDVATTTVYGHEYVSSVCKGNIWGVQFHPEKSQSVGLSILRNFVEFKL